LLRTCQNLAARNREDLQCHQWKALTLGARQNPIRTGLTAFNLDEVLRHLQEAPGSANR
jgi:hypothetical protein